MFGDYNRQYQSYIQRGYVSTAPGTFQFINPMFGALSSRVDGMSGDGRVFAATSGDPQFALTVAYRATADGQYQYLGQTRPEHFASRAYGISRDGRVIIGESFGVTTSDGFIWTQESGFQVLPDLPGTTWNAARPLAVNHNGSIVVGVSGDQDVMIWRDGVPEYLASREFTPRSLSDDGSIIIAQADYNLQYQSVLLLGGGSYTTLSDYLRSLGVVIDQRLIVRSATVSADGRTFTGSVGTFMASDFRSFVFTVPAPASLSLGVLIILAASKRRVRH
jgi:uncharacterized membrane protein